MSNTYSAVPFVPDPSQTIPPAAAGLPGFSSPSAVDIELPLPDPFTVEPVIRKLSPPPPVVASQKTLLFVGVASAVAGFLLVFAAAGLLFVGGLTVVL